MPSFLEAFVADANVPQHPPAHHIDNDALNAALANIEGLVSGEAVSVPAPLSGVAPAQYPTTVAEWSDQMLSSVDDFSAVLVALRAGKLIVNGTPEISETPMAVAEAPTAPVNAEATVSPEMIQHQPVETPGITAEAPSGLGVAESPAWIEGGTEDDAESRVLQSLASVNTEWAAELAIQDETPAAPVAEVVEHHVEAVMDAHAQAAIPVPEAEMAKTAEVMEPAAEAALLHEQTEAPVETGVAEAATPERAIAQAPEQPIAEAETHGQPGAEQTFDPMAANAEFADEGLPPWLQDEAVANEASAQNETMVAQNALTFESLGEGTWLGDLAAQDAMAATEAAGTPEAILTPDVTATTSETAGDSETEERMSLPGVPEGKLSGDDLEFEPFMFNSGAAPALPALPGMAEFMPVVESMEATIEGVQATPQAPVEAAPVAGIAGDEEALPFWLQESSTVEQGDGQAEASIEMQATAEGVMQPASPEMTSAPLAGEAPDFNDLPPIEPFDFSALEQSVEEERLGFNTEELSGTVPNSHEPLMVTANLDVLADLLERERSSGTLDARSISLGLKAARPQDESTGNITSPSLADEDMPTTWGGGVDTGVMKASSASKAGAEMDTGVADFDVAPFDITDLNLDSEEQHTGHLNTGYLDRANSDPDTLFTGTLFTESDSEQTASWEAPDWMGDPDTATDKVTESALSDNDMDTARFRGNTSSLDSNSTSGWMGTGLLDEVDTESATSQPGEESQIEANAEESAPPDEAMGIFRARVSRFRIEEQYMTPSTQENEPEAEGEVEPNYALDSGADGERNYALDYGDEKERNYALDYNKDEGTSINLEAEGHLEPDVEAAHVPEMPGAPDPAETADAAAGTHEAETTSAQPAPQASQVAISTPAPPVPGASMPSGPLENIPGFEPLEAIVASKPTDFGAHMALAVRYAEEGFIDHALHEFQRLISQRGVPPSMLQIVADQVADLESQVDNKARFHKVYGDLLMKQGRFEDAIEEYNKIT
jgi:hypothetical protein